ncbi:MAG: FIG002344: Hydrolase (HAD superfamily) [uncultured Sulfurovum sp.]|uniref:Ribonuclease Y n=1 Tax=uncultured Sulfurovum sp. TaxID=269237 RepID=A0A6S6SYB2_9BACT|nr:MAG: FIG002344: Hydrolase (HAD superfamily) [uncultured Sulfurovum sp.]
MLEVVGVAGVVTGAFITYVWMKNSSGKKFIHLEDEAKVKAKMLEQEAKLLIESSKIKIREQELALEESFKTREMAVDAREHALSVQEKAFFVREEKLNTLEKYTQKLEVSRQKEINNTLAAMESIASFTKEEAKAYILEKVEENSRADVADIVRRYEQEAKRDGEKKANYILAQATTRYAGDFAGERLINFISLPSDEHKGRIIGKEGRNIKTLEMLLGVDIVVDETPGVILVSCFNLYRRAIATRVIEILIEDGRIHPGHIEEVHKKVEKEFEEKTYEEGENILLDLGLFPMAKELVQLLGRMKYRASYGQNALAHTLEVAYLAKVMAAQMGGDEKLALRAGLLHDIGKALTQEHGGSHVDIGVDLCRKHGEHPSIINAIYAHHGYEEADSVESAAVCAADKLSAARPGARREVLESFTKRVKEVEEIALSKKNVMKAYAINAGREIRVFVNAQKTSDNESILLSKEIAKEVQEKVQYPGEIKVNVIRETRATSYAK